MIIVQTSSGEVEFDGSQARTDEHNNLELLDDGRLIHLFNRTDWQSLEIDYG